MSLRHVDQQNAPAVSVIIPAYNIAQFLPAALRSVQLQTMADFEALIIDDGSSDDIAAAVAPFLADARFRLISKPNGGVSSARNLGLAHARADIVSMLDGDDLYRNTYLERMLSRFNAAPSVDFVTCDAVSFGLAANNGERFSDRYPQGEPITLDRYLRREVAVISSSLVRKSAMEKIGGYDEALREAEDLDLWLRLLSSGAVGGLVPDIMVEYRRRPHSLSQSTARLMHSTAATYAKVIAASNDAGVSALADARRSAAQSHGDFEAGVDLALFGADKAAVQQGVKLMRQSRFKSGNAKWSAAFIAFSCLPVLARPALARYRRGN
jgi:glycosyltransferase involved in cell wall biosynthesis